jgi:uncharacterized protein YggE
MTRWLRPIVFVAPLLVGALAVAPRAASAQDMPETPRLSVRGQATLSVPPDVAVVTLGAVARRETAQAAFNQASTTGNQLQEFLRAQGVAERDITTRQLSLTPEFGRAVEGQGAPLVGWRATNILTVKIRDFSQIGAIIDGAARILGNDAQISGISFAVEDTAVIAARARELAIADARQRAEQIAAAAGVRLVRILSITENFAPPPTPVPVARAPVAAAAAAPEIAPGEQNLTVSVEIVYEIA